MLTQQAEETQKYWRKTLQRIISVIRFLCERGLSFRDKTEIFGSPDNGNYFSLLELLAEYDDFLKEHIFKYGNYGRGHVNYLPSTICEKIIELLGKKVFNEIILRMKRSHYYFVSILRRAGTQKVGYPRVGFAT